tara:strand:- start:3386 stop:3790 length:405 start_codon:yes stop_codon:yes gene_type:complete
MTSTDINIFQVYNRVQAQVLHLDRFLASLPDPELDLSNLMIWQYILMARHELIMQEATACCRQNKDLMKKFFRMIDECRVQDKHKRDAFGYLAIDPPRFTLEEICKRIEQVATVATKKPLDLIKEDQYYGGNCT